MRLILLCGVFTLLSGKVQAANVFWFERDGDWMQASNWIPKLPGSADTVYIDNGCGGPLTTTGNAQAGILYLGFNTENNTAEQRGILPNTLTVSELRIGEGPGSTGRYILGGVGRLNANSEQIGLSGTGSFVQYGGTNQVTGTILLRKGTYELHAGTCTSQTITLWGRTFSQLGGTVTTNNLYLYHWGEALPSAYEISGSAQLTAQTIWLGPEEGAIAPRRIIQQGGTVTTNRLRMTLGPAFYTLSNGQLSTGTNEVKIARNHNATGGDVKFTQSGGSFQAADIQLGGGGDASADLGGNGTLSCQNLRVGGSATTESVGGEWVGTRGIGQFSQTGGVTTVASLLSLGPTRMIDNTGVGGGADRCTANCYGGIYTLQSGDLTTSETRVGDAESGHMIQQGGTHAVSTLLYLGVSSGQKGLYDLSGGSLSAFIEYVGYDGIGEFNHTGGRNTANQIYIGRNATSPGAPPQKYTLSGNGELFATTLFVARAGLSMLSLDGGTVKVDTMEVGRLTGQGILGFNNASVNATIGKSFVLGTNALFDAVPGSVIHMAHDTANTVGAAFNNFSKQPLNVSGLQHLELRFETDGTVMHSVELACRDLGATEAGFTGNFALGTLSIPNTPAHIMLVDTNDNGNRGAGGQSEALYVDRIQLAAGSTFDLNGKNVYYRALCDAGGTVLLNGGHLTQVGINADLDCDADVDFDDAVIFKACATRSRVPQPDSVCRQKADFDGDADVDMDDFGIFQLLITTTE
jgi:hypothetical protein